jgi:hypothetical protein
MKPFAIRCRVFECVEPRSFTSLERHMLTESMRHDQNIGKQDCSVKAKAANGPSLPMAQAPGYFHLHLISDATGETLITVAVIGGSYEDEIEQSSGIMLCIVAKRAGSTLKAGPASACPSYQ